MTAVLFLTFDFSLGFVFAVFVFLEVVFVVGFRFGIFVRDFFFIACFPLHNIYDEWVQHFKRVISNDYSLRKAESSAFEAQG